MPNEARQEVAGACASGVGEERKGTKGKESDEEQDMAGSLKAPAKRDWEVQRDSTLALK